MMEGAPSLEVIWREEMPAFAAWRALHPAARPRLVGTGREAEIWRYDEGVRPCWVLKRWTRWTWVEAERAYRFLRVACDLALPVPEGTGWGRDPAGIGVLAMSWAGVPVTAVTPADLERLADILAEVHATPLAPFGTLLPGMQEGPAQCYRASLAAAWRQHPDLAALSAALAADLPPAEPRLIHGDFHLGNITRIGTSLIVGDWTEARRGDTRWDLAWANLLLLIYTGEWAYRTFDAAYRERTPVEPDVLRRLEALAGVDWLLLARTAPVPIEAEKLAAVDAWLRARVPVEMLRLVRP